MRSLAIAVSIVAGMLLPACGLFEEEAPRPVLMPLAEGNTWTYTMTLAGEPAATVTYRVGGRVPVDRFEYTRIDIERHTFATGEVTFETLYAYHDEGLWYYDSAGPRRRVLAYFRYPIDPGDFYYNVFEKQICTEAAEDVDMPAGTFDAIVYGECVNFGPTRTMFAPGVGPIFWGDLAGEAFYLVDYDVK